MQTEPSHILPLIIGHRGASYNAPENTMESFRLAWAQGADGCEADFRLTADGHIVCMHDATTGRTSDEDRVIAASTLRELRCLDAGFHKGAAWRGIVIPTLDEVLAALPKGSRFFIELKSGPEIIEALSRVLRRSGVSPEQIRLLAFSAPLIVELKQRLPGWSACWLSDYRHSMITNTWRPSKEEVLDTLFRSGADGLASAARTILDEDFVTALREQGKQIHVWTVDRPAEARRLCRLGVDSIMTNHPGWLHRQLADLYATSTGQGTKGPQ